MDHYKTLGLNRSASKEEIKEAFRRSALKFHPDRHAQSSKDVQDGAALKFKQASEAYEVLVDDRRRADYDRARRSGSSDRWGGGRSSYYGGRQHSYSSNYGDGGGYRRPPPRRDGIGGFDMEFVLRFVTRRAFLVNVAFASALLGGSFFIERSVAKFWKMNNSGKSFEETMEAIEKVKVKKDHG